MSESEPPARKADAAAGCLYGLVGVTLFVWLPLAAMRWC